MKDNIVFQNYKNRKIMIRSRKLISTSTGIVTGNKKGTYYMSVMRHYDDGACKRILSKLIGKIISTEVEEKLEVVSKPPPPNRI
jgi:hypothetical protein